MTAEPEILDPQPDARSVAARTAPPTAASMEPIAIVAGALGGVEWLARRVVVALGDAGWAFVHRDDPRERVTYRPKAEGGEP